MILSLDSDFLFSEPGHLRYGQISLPRHQPISASGTMSRLYVVESSATLTGSNADHRLAVKPSQVEAFARAVASRLGVGGSAPPARCPGKTGWTRWWRICKRAGRAALVIAGERQPAGVHALAHAMNQALGSIGNTVNLVAPLAGGAAAAGADAAANAAISLQALAQDLNGGAVDTLVILEDNPVYTAPADLNFAEALKKAKQSIYLAYYPDETAAQATWVIPAAHYMEMWGDARPLTARHLIQPVIEPLYGGKSPYELVAALLGQGDAKGYDLVRGYWQKQMQGGNFERDWRDLLGKGLVANMPAQAAQNLPQVGADAFSGGRIAAAPRPAGWRLFSSRTIPSGTGALATMPGCKSCPSR